MNEVCLLAAYAVVFRLVGYDDLLAFLSDTRIEAQEVWKILAACSQCQVSECTTAAVMSQLRMCQSEKVKI